MDWGGAIHVDFDPDTLLATGETDAYSITVQFQWHAGQYRMAQVEKTDKATGGVSTLRDAEWTRAA